MWIHRKRKIAVKSGHIPLKNIHFYLCTAKRYRINILLLYRLKQSDIMHTDFCSLRYFSSPVFRRQTPQKTSPARGLKAALKSQNRLPVPFVCRFFHGKRRNRDVKNCEPCKLRSSFIYNIIDNCDTFI